MDIKRIEIVEYEGTGGFKEATIFFKKGELKTIKTKSDLLEYIIMFSNQTGINYEELVELKLIKVQKVEKKESLGGPLRIGNLSSDVGRYLVPSGIINWEASKNITLVADIDAYQRYRVKVDNHTNAPKLIKTSYIVEKMDNTQGKKDSASTRSYRIFLDNVSEDVTPSFMEQESQDLKEINIDEGAGNFESKVYDKFAHANNYSYIDGFEIIGYTSGYTKSNKELVSKDLCCGVVYVDNREQQRFLQLRNNHFYVNRSSSDDEQVWIPVEEADARKAIISKGLRAFTINGSIRNFFGFDLNGDKPEITEVVHKGAKR